MRILDWIRSCVFVLLNHLYQGGPTKTVFNKMPTHFHHLFSAYATLYPRHSWTDWVRAIHRGR